MGVGLFNKPVSLPIVLGVVNVSMRRLRLLLHWKQEIRRRLCLMICHIRCRGLISHRCSRILRVGVVRVGDGTSMITRVLKWGRGWWRWVIALRIDRVGRRPELKPIRGGHGRAARIADVSLEPQLELAFLRGQLVQHSVEFFFPLGHRPELAFEPGLDLVSLLFALLGRLSVSLSPHLSFVLLVGREFDVFGAAARRQRGSRVSTRSHRYWPEPLLHHTLAVAVRHYGCYLARRRRWCRCCRILEIFFFQISSFYLIEKN